MTKKICSVCRKRIRFWQSTWLWKEKNKLFHWNCAEKQLGWLFMD